MSLRTACVLLLLAPAGAAAQVEPGNWELTVTMEIQGQKLGPISRTECFTEADAQDPSRVLGTGAGCAFSNRREEGELYTFDVSCAGALPMSGSGRIRQSAESFEGVLDLAVDAAVAGAAGIPMRSEVSGRRLGPC